MQVLRVNLYWGGTQVGRREQRSRPTPTDPGDPAYNWSLYDRLVKYAALNNIQVVFSILFTPAVGERRQGEDGRADELRPICRSFAYAAAERYSGFWTPPSWQQRSDARDRATTASRREHVDGVERAEQPRSGSRRSTSASERKWRIESAYQYAKICNAVYSGIHGVLISPARGLLTGEQVACGVTGPKGNDAPTSKRAVRRPALLPRSQRTASG